MEIATQILRQLEAFIALGQGMDGMTPDLERGLGGHGCLLHPSTLCLKKFLLITPDPVPETPPPGSLPACPRREPCFPGLSQPNTFLWPGPDPPHDM